MKPNPGGFSRRSFVQRLIALGILSIMLLASILVYFATDDFLQQRSVQKFQQDTSTTTNHIAQQMVSYTDLLYTARALLSVKPDISNAEWSTFFSSQDTFNRYKGTSSVVYGTYIRGASSSQAASRVNAQAQTSSPISITPAGSRPEYVVVSLLSSHNNLQNILGYDVLTMEERKYTLEAARIAETPQASAPSMLLSKVPGLFISLPHYDSNNRLLGFVAVSFRSSELGEQFLEEVPRGVAIQIVDNGKSGVRHIFASPEWRAQSDLQRTDTITVAGRLWDISYQASGGAYQDFTSRVISLAVLVFGLSISILVFVMVVAIFRIRFSLFGHRL